MKKSWILWIRAPAAGRSAGQDQGKGYGHDYELFAFSSLTRGLSGLSSMMKHFKQSLVLCLMFCAVSTVMAQQGPEISLDTTELVNDIRATRSVATDVESSLAEALQSVASQTEAMKSAGCNPESTTTNCRVLKSMLRDEYLGVLEKVESRLPALSSAVLKVVRNIEVRMGAQAGTTASDVQDDLVDRGATGDGSGRLALQGVSGSRLSESLGRLQTLVSSTQAPGASFRTIQADLYLDMRSALSVIDNISADIQRTRILAELQLGDIQVGEDEERIAEEARRLLFGDAADAPFAAPDMPTGSPSTGSDSGRSPLEL